MRQKLDLDNNVRLSDIPVGMPFHFEGDGHDGNRYIILAYRCSAGAAEGFVVNLYTGYVEEHDIGESVHLHSEGHYSEKEDAAGD